MWSLCNLFSKGICIMFQVIFWEVGGKGDVWGGSVGGWMDGYRWMDK